MLERAFDDVADRSTRICAAIAAGDSRLADDESNAEPAFVELLVRQPRAGRHASGPASSRARARRKPRRSLLGRHRDGRAARTALWDADPAEAFLTGLSHHLFNATLPDAGYAGDVLIGGDLIGRMMLHANDQQIATLPDHRRPLVRDSIDRTKPNGFDEPAARAFHAADVLDRVGEMAWHERSARFRLIDALGSDTRAGQLDICHRAFTKTFQHDVLTSAGSSMRRSCAR